MNLVSGEIIQNQCDIYCGFMEDFRYNPKINNQPDKCLDINNINKTWNNPRIIFCYGHRISEFKKIMHYMQNNFIFVTHNSDENITDKYIDIADDPKLDIWYAQNLMVNHHKIKMLPIGIANSMWKHGDIAIIKNVIGDRNKKINDIYFYFNIYTNVEERNECKEILEQKGLKFGKEESYQHYIKTLSTYKYAICPPGNGVDSHRIWECIYLDVIPIVKKSIFTEKLNEEYRCVILDNWDDFDKETLLNVYNDPKYNLYNYKEL